MRVGARVGACQCRCVSISVDTCRMRVDACRFVSHNASLMCVSVCNG